MKYLFLFLPILCFGQLPSVKLIDERDVTPVILKLNGSSKLVVGRGVSYRALYLALEGIDSSRATEITLTVSQPTGTPTEPVFREMINDDDPRIIYTGTWKDVPNQTWTARFFNTDVRYTTQVGATAQVQFNGRKIEVISEKKNNHGVARIQILNGPTVIASADVDMFANTPDNGPAVIFSKEVPVGTYVAKVIFLSNTQTRDSMVLDGVKIYD